MSAARRRSHAGFTLIEVLVAMAIFASMSIAAYQVLNQVQRSNDISLERSKRLNEMQRAIVMMDSDFRQIAARQFRTNGKEANEGYLQWQNYLLDSDSQGVMFVRLGWPNPQQQFPRGNLTKVGYRLKEHVLERLWWQYPDTTLNEPPVVMPLLTGVDSWSMRFYFDGKWSDEWDETDALPKAVEVTLKLQDYGDIKRIYLVAGSDDKKKTSSGDSNESE
ncbi:type II secretion system minor pseudopilin GspJ [Vibrio porteresiae]|uniref:Type II secretion system protein J n=1 Tax=Vibrio porteresiae DSM 19223 TaxID=1123496 RepID=A0ABZ0QBZ3_9VIBR|nr:type II secretion system minor pseudopilin GspJ [Vibrio porteresiae]WPC73973.1 type II secretion system minor pseudopilin GspJ [Vibrio porteresiae DSM 19223]